MQLSLETIDCDIGRQSQDTRSRLCKHSLFLDFLQLWDKLVPDEFRGILTAEYLQKYCSYGQVKSLAGDYQLANLIVVVAHTGSRSLTNKITLQ